MKGRWEFRGISVEPSDQLISFGSYQLDRAGGRLRRDGTNVPLRLKTFAVLEFLATHPARLVTKEELLNAVWPETHVTPSVLTGCIRELRQALGDDARAARFVETAHRRGYRFIAAIMIPPPETSADAGGSPPAGDVELVALARRFAEAVAQILARRGRHPGKPAGG